MKTQYLFKYCIVFAIFQLLVSCLPNNGGTPSVNQNIKFSKLNSKTYISGVLDSEFEDSTLYTYSNNRLTKIAISTLGNLNIRYYDAFGYADVISSNGAKITVPYNTRKYLKSISNGIESIAMIYDTTWTFVEKKHTVINFTGNFTYAEKNYMYDANNNIMSFERIKNGVITNINYEYYPEDIDYKFHPDFLNFNFDNLWYGQSGFDILNTMGITYGTRKGNKAVKKMTSGGIVEEYFYERDSKNRIIKKIVKNSQQNYVYLSTYTYRY
jgi:hypothetical protein